MLKKLVYLLVIIATLVVMNACAGYPAIGLFGNPADCVVMSEVNGNSVKTAELSGSTFNIFGSRIGSKTFPTIAETARHGRITKVATVEYYTKPLFFGLFTTYTTIVTGE